MMRSHISARGVDFLGNWIAKNVTAGAPPDDPLHASALANRCIADATAEGLTLEEIQPDSGSLESNIFDAMVHLNEGTPGK